MGRVPQDVMQHPLDLAWQDAFTYASWGIVAVMLVFAVRMGLAQRTPFFLLAIAAAGIGAFAEPLYDVAFDLWFYDATPEGAPGAADAHFTAFGIVQPNWTHSGYIILYAMAALYAGRAMLEGRITRRTLFLFWGLEILASCVFEVIGTGVDVYTYYGPYELRIWEYPLVIGVLEGTQVMLFTVLAVRIWKAVGNTAALGLVVVVFPITMLGGNFGLGWPVIIALHLQEPEFSSTLVWVGTFLSMALCATAVYAASLFLPRPPAAPAAPARQAGAPAGVATTDERQLVGA
jgi:hypothetical protein